MHPVRIWSSRPGSSRQRGVRDVGSREQVLRCYTQLQWTSACWHPAHFTVQYLSEPTCRCPASCSPATDPQIAHFHPSLTRRTSRTAGSPSAPSSLLSLVLPE